MIDKMPMKMKMNLSVQMLVLLFVHQCAGDATWNASAEFIVQRPKMSLCQERCFAYDSELSGALIVKSRNICKCIYTCRTCSQEQCASMCEESERLEGASRDECSYIDNVCYTHKFLREQ